MHNIKLSTSLIILLPLIMQITCLKDTFALDEVTLSKYREDASKSATTMLPQVNSYFHDSLKTKDIQNTMGFENDHPVGTDMPIQEAEMYGTRSQETGPDKENPDYEYQCNKKKCEVGHTLSSQAMLNRQEEVDKAMIIRDEKGNIIDHKAFVDNILDNQKKAESEFASINGSQAACTTITENFIKTTPDNCDSYYDYTTNSCYPKQIVEIDPKYNYACSKKREIKEKVCSDEITSISCIKNSSCDYGGIVEGSVASGMVLNLSPGLLTLGSKSDNEWNGNCLVVDKRTTFYAKNVSKIQEFILTSVGFDDYMLVRVNGHVVYVGPDGGDRLELKNMGFNTLVYNGSSYQNCERGRNWVFDPNIDLKPYLQEGENIIEIRVIVGGVGEGWLQIKAKSHCCAQFDVKREERCEYR